MEDAPTPIARREPRYKLLRIGVEEMLTLLGGWRGHEFVSLPILKGLPDGYSVDAATFSFDLNAIVVRVYHDTFPLVHPGSLTATIPMDYEVVRLPTTGQGAANG